MDHVTQVLTNLAGGFGLALGGTNLIYGAVGVLLGTATGVLPGLGPAVAISLLLPMTFGFDPLAAFIMFGGIYYGAMYGGAITAILVNTPGCAASAVSTFDGHPMAKRGLAGPALATAAISSFIGGTFATLMLTFLAPMLVEVALYFGPPDYFSLMLLALTMIAAVSGRSALKAAFATFLGLGISTIGIDMQTGASRMTFGIPELYGGVDVVIGGIGLFAVGEALWIAAGGGGTTDTISAKGARLWLNLNEWRRASMSWVRGSLLGFFAGILPGSGGTIASFLAYTVEKRVSRSSSEFGEGAIEGLAAPEAANNAAAGGSLVPLLALGIPGSATTAVMLAAFHMYGIQPGPMLFTGNAALVWGLIASLYIANVLLVVLNLPLVGLWTRLLSVPKGILYSAVLVFASLGAYSLKGSVADVLAIWVLGVLAFVLRKFEVPIAPILLGLVLGPLLEQEFRRSMTLSAGNLSVFVTSWVSLTFLILTLLSIAGSVAAGLSSKRPAQA